MKRTPVTVFIFMLITLFSLNTGWTKDLKQDDFYGKLTFKDGTVINYTWLRTSGYGMEKIPYTKELSFHEDAGSLNKFNLLEVKKFDIIDEWCAWDLPGGKSVPEYARINQWVYKVNVTFKDGTKWNDIYIYGPAWMWRNNKEEGNMINVKSITINIR